MLAAGAVSTCSCGHDIPVTDIVNGEGELACRYPTSRDLAQTGPKTDVGFLAPNWFLSIRTPERLARTYGLFDPVTVELRLCMDVQHIAC